PERALIGIDDDEEVDLHATELQERLVERAGGGYRRRGDELGCDLVRGGFTAAAVALDQGGDDLIAFVGRVDAVGGLLHQIPLHEIATEVAADEEFLFGLHAFSDDDAAEEVRELDHRLRQHALLPVALDAFDEEAVDLHEVRGAVVEELEP